MESLVGILLVVFLILTFVLLYVLNHRTPPPEGSENYMPSSEKCSSCSNSGCGLKHNYSSGGK